MRPAQAFLVLFWAPLVLSFGFDHKWKKEKLLELEHYTMSGQKTIPLIKDEEKKANNIIMDVKKKEYDAGIIDSTKFLPFLKFQKAKKLIQKSTLFKIIKKFPKGANLHTHLEAMSSFKELLKLTSFDHLYACKKRDTIKFKFMKKPNDDCLWKPVKYLKDDSFVFEGVLKKLIVLENENLYEYNHNKTSDDLKKSIETITDIITYRPIFQTFINNSLYELYKDNIFYVELRTFLPNLYDIDGTIYPESETARIILETSREFCKIYPDFLGVRIIYNPCYLTKTNSEHYSKIALELKDKFPNFLAGVDFSGCYDYVDNKEYLHDTLESLKKDDINVFSHAGRSNFFGYDDESLFDALTINSKRIGGAEAILKHPKVMETIKFKHVPIEILPISSQILGYCKWFSNHAGGHLIVEDFNIIIGNDKPTCFGSKGLSYDFYEFFMGVVSRKHDLKMLKQMALNSIEHSSMPLKEKLIAVKNWQKLYDDFCDWITKTDVDKLDKDDKYPHEYNHDDFEDY